ncbi:MAG: c-type cytochrome [Actinobacteria bacterium]|nr:c-type cytochrome [Actinomycetota bacterium]
MTALRARHLRLVPVVAAVAVAVAGLLGAQAQAAEEEEHDPLGYVIDLAAVEDPESVADGAELYLTGCVSCHGLGGVGSPRGPAITDAGAASAHFYLTTGRMPHAAGPDEQPVRKEPAYDPEEIEDLVAYVASLGEGPEIPHVDLAEANLQEGGDLYRGQCAACHSATGAGGALSFGQNAPALGEATPVQVYEAMLIGPGLMPVFGPETFSEEELNSMVRYVEALQDVPDPGGFALGRVGPMPEGFVAVIIGTGAVTLAAFLIGSRRHGEAEGDSEPVRPADASEGTGR